MTNTLMISSTNNREQLETQQQQLMAQLKQLQFQLFDKTSPDVVEHINQLQLEKAKQQGILQQAQQQLNQLTPELESFDSGAEQILLEAITGQRWWLIKNKREIVYDSHSGWLWPNFEFVPMINYSIWSQKDFELHGIAKGSWTIEHSDLIFQRDIKKFIGKKYLHKGNGRFYLYQQHSFHGKAFFYTEDCDGVGAVSDNYGHFKVLPCSAIFNNTNLDPSYPKYTKLEKAKMVLDFFLEQDWQATFDKTEHQRIFDAMMVRKQTQKKLVDIEQQIAQLPAPEPINLFTSDFNYRQEVQHYNLAEINTSVWQYSLAAQQWLNYLLNQIDDWANRHQHLLAHALELNNKLAKKQATSLNLTDNEKQFLNTRHQQLQQALNMGLDGLRAALIDLLQQAQHLELQLKNTTSLTALAELERQARPTFALLAEHSATLCTQTLKKLEWLEQSLDFVQEIVKSEQQTTESYLILVDKNQQDLLQQGINNSVEAEQITAWFSEWRQERLLMLKQWQPLIEAGLQGVISEQTVLDTLQCMQHYQQQLDAFYTQKRLGIHTTYAFFPNGHRQEKLEKEQELIKLNHQFMQQLEKVIFSTSHTAQKIWLVRFSEVWQQSMVQEIIGFLEKEQLIDRSDIVQIMSEELRQLQQQSFASVLQDAKDYSQALAQREKDTSTLIFKMRKALKV